MSEQSKIALPALPSGIAPKVDREALQNKQRQLAKEMWSGKLTMNEQSAVDMISREFGLNPLLKQLVVLAGGIYVTKAGLQVIANRKPETAIDGIEVSPVSQEERELAGIAYHEPTTAEYQHYWKAIVWKKGSSRPFVEFGEATLSNVKLFKPDWRSVSDMAKTRAVNRALRNAYDIGFPSVEEMGYASEEVQSIQARVVEEPQPANGQAKLEPVKGTPPAPVTPPAPITRIPEPSQPHEEAPEAPPAGPRRLTGPQMARFWAKAHASKKFTKDQIEQVCDEAGWGTPTTAWSKETYEAAVQYFREINLAAGVDPAKA